MGTDERKAKEKEIRRNDIIDAAERIFFRDGYEAATMDQIARAAEFSKRTVYVYFSSKEQLYFEIMIRGYKLLIAMLDKVESEEKSGNAVERIRKLARQVHAFSAAYPEYFAAIAGYETGDNDFGSGIPDASREECYALGEKLAGFLAGPLDAGIAEGSIQPGLDVPGTTLILWASIIGIFGTVRKKAAYIRNMQQRDPDELVLHAVELLLRAIRKEIQP